MSNIESTVLRLEQEDAPDVHERIRHAVDAMRVDGWNPVGAISSVQTNGLYLVFERAYVEEDEVAK